MVNGKMVIAFSSKMQKTKNPSLLVKDFYAKKNKNVLGSLCRRDFSALVT